MQAYRMIKSKVLDVKIIFETYLKSIKNRLKLFQVPNRLLFYKISKNYFQKLF